MKILWKMEHLLRRANALFSIMFQIHSMSKVSKGVIMRYRVNTGDRLTLFISIDYPIQVDTIRSIESIHFVFYGVTG